MLLGTTPNLGSGLAGGGLAAAAASVARAGAVVRANSAAFARGSGHNDPIPRCVDEDDELMMDGMSPDLPSMIRSPISGVGFSDYLKQTFANAASGSGPVQSSLAAAAAAPNEQVPTMVSTYQTDGLCS